MSEKIIWKKINFKFEKRREWDLAKVFCNPEKALKKLWWRAEVGLEESLKHSWDFVKTTNLL